MLVVHYRTLRTLGTGAGGWVDEVLPDRLGAEPLARRRAPVPAGPARARLRDQAEALARLGHPAIATVVDLVEVDDDHVEVVRTLGTDGTLADRLAAGPLPTQEADAVVRALEDALAAAHAVGVAHGNVSASNVLARDGGWLLADFGLASAGDDRSPGDPFATDLDALGELARTLRPAGPAPQPPGGRAAAALPHWTERPGARPVPAASGPTPAATARRGPERLVAGALAFGIGGAVGVTFVLVETLTGRA